MKLLLYIICFLVCCGFTTSDALAVELPGAEESYLSDSSSENKNTNRNSEAIGQLDEMIKNLKTEQDGLDEDESERRVELEARIQALERMKKHIETHPDKDTGTVLDEAADEGKELMDQKIRNYVDQIHSALAKQVFQLGGLSADEPYAVAATGQTSGLIATLTVINDTDAPHSFTFPPGEIPSAAGKQRLATRRTISGEVPPQTTVTFDVNDGFCIEPFAPVPLAGEMLSTPTRWQFNTITVRKLQRIVQEVTAYLESGKVDLPFADNIEDTIDIVSLYTVWTDTPYGSITPQDLCEKWIRDFQNTTGISVDDLPPVERDMLDRGILQTLEAVETVGKNVGIPHFQDPPLPPEAHLVTSAPQSTHPEIAETIEVVSTGNITGHIADLTITNPSDKPVIVYIGEGYLYLPSDGKHQGMSADPLPAIPLGPGESVTVPVFGACTDNSIPVRPTGAGYDHPADWIGIGGPVGLPPAPPLPALGEPVLIPTKTSLPIDRTAEILEDLSEQAGTSTTSCIQRTLVPEVLYPGSDIPLPVNFDPVDAPSVGVTLTLNSYKYFKEQYHELVESGNMQTVFSFDRYKEEWTYILWKNWIFNKALKGGELPKSQWDKVTKDEVGNILGTPFEQIEDSRQQKIEVDLDNLWAKININVKETSPLTTPVPAQETAPAGSPWNSIDAGDKPGRHPDRTTAANPGITEVEQKRRCIEFPVDPVIDGRGGYDLFGDLYRRGHLDADYVDMFRNGRIKQKVQALQAMHHALQTMLSGEFNMFPCDDDEYIDRPTQPFPEIPFEQFFLEIDLCDPANADRDRLIDFLSPDADPEALEAWLQDFENAINNLGFWNPGTPGYVAAMQQTINQALQGIAAAYAEFQSDMEVSMELRFNESEAWNNLWVGVATIVAAAITAGVAAGIAGTAAAALSSAIVSTSGFVFEQGMQAMGMDPRVAALVSSVITLSMGAAGGLQQGFVSFVGEEIVTSVPSTVIGEGINAMAQQNVQGYAMSMAMLNDDVWDALIEQLSEDYRADAIAQFNAYRDELRAEVQRQVNRLCEVYRTLDRRLDEVVAAQQAAAAMLHSSFWRDEWNKVMDASLDCCCRYSDGSAGQNCHFQIPAQF